MYVISIVCAAPLVYVIVFCVCSVYISGRSLSHFEKKIKMGKLNDAHGTVWADTSKKFFLFLFNARIDYFCLSL